MAERPHFATMPTFMSLLVAEHLVKSYDGRVRAVDDVSFAVAEGEILGLLGPNGAGKTTSMMMVSGFLPADAGDITIQGSPVAGDRLNVRYLLGVVPQDLAIYHELTANENLAFFGKLYGLSGEGLASRIERVLKEIGLTDRRHDQVCDYSGGMKRRLNLGIGMLHDPKLLILDEPTVGVDPQSRAHLLECIRRRRDEGAAVIYASHYMEEVQAVCDRIAIIDHGHIIADDTLENLLRRVEGRIEIVVKGWTPDTASQLDAEIESEPTDDGHVRLSLRSKAGARGNGLEGRLAEWLSALDRHGVRVVHIETHRPNLENLFLELTGRHLRE